MSNPVQPLRDPSGEEARLIARTRQGDSTAFDELVTLHRQRVFATIYNVVRNEEDAWDLSQEAFLRAWKRIGSFKGDASFATWLYRIAMNVTIDSLRRKRAEKATEFDDSVNPREIEPGAPTLPKPVATPHRQMEHAEIRRRLDEALARLSPEHRMVITLREIDGASYEEIAAAMGCSLGTVMSRLFYARKKLQTMLGDLYETT